MELDDELTRQLQRQLLPVSLAAIKASLNTERGSTYDAYAQAWRKFAQRGGRWTLAHLVDHCVWLASAGGRPAATIGQFQATVALIHDAANEPSPFGEPLVKRVLRGVRREGTTKPRDPGPVLDMAKVLEYLRLTSAEGYVDRRLASAALAAQVPSRPRELCRLKLKDVVVVVHNPTLGQDHERVRADHWPSLRRVQVGQPFPSFHLDVRVLESKTDQTTKTGITKALQHPPGASWSPALMLLAWLTRPGAHDHTYVFSRTDGRDMPLAVATLSNDLALVAHRATGVRVTGRFWRPAAATWLLRCGLDVETVAALGGWSSTDSLRRYYVRAFILTPTVARTIAGLPPDNTPVSRSRGATSTPGTKIVGPLADLAELDRQRRAGLLEHLPPARGGLPSRPPLAANWWESDDDDEEHDGDDESSVSSSDDDAEVVLLLARAAEQQAADDLERARMNLAQGTSTQRQRRLPRGGQVAHRTPALGGVQRVPQRSVLARARSPTTTKKLWSLPPVHHVPAPLRGRKVEHK